MKARIEELHLLDYTKIIGEDMNQYKEKFDQYTNEHLITMRAMADDLAEEAHLAIEQIFIERGATLPPRPTAPVIIDDSISAKTKEYFKLAGAFLVFFLGMFTAKVLAQTWIAILISVGVLAYWIYEKTSFDSEEKIKRKAAKKAEAENFNELMHKSAEGDLPRVIDLINYGSNLNEQSISGYTALMLAIRNNHLEVVEALLQAGADASLRTNQGTSALDVAKKNCEKTMIDKISDSLNQALSVAKG